VVRGTSASIDLHGHLSQPSWTRLALPAAAGEDALTLQDCVDWPVGSTLLVASTHRVDWRGHTQSEEATVASVECNELSYTESDGTSSLRSFGVITLSESLSHPHYAGRGEYQAEVGLLSRNVVVRGDPSTSPATDLPPAGAVCSSEHYSSVTCTDYHQTGYGGHLIVLDGAAARLSAAEFYMMGQTNIVGRYPIHLHLLGEAGSGSSVSDCSIHGSFYRGVVIHGTSNALVTRNVAFDIVGHCYYLESGAEENNVISYNLGALVHPIGHFSGFKGQETEMTFSSADLGGNPAIPADAAASPFYISNMRNKIQHNAAVGGFSGFAMVSLPKVIGALPADFFGDSSFAPFNRPGLPDGFYGNSARSSTTWWNMAPAFYVGGILWLDENSGDLLYIPGRSLANARKPVNDDGSNAWYTFVNNKASLCEVGGGDWNKRSKWYNTDITDFTKQSFNVFGEVVFRNSNVQCRTANGLAMEPTTDVEDIHDKAWQSQTFKVFRSYDTGQKHVLVGWRISGCGSASAPMATDFRDALIWTFPHGVNVNQNQLAMRNITYVDGPPLAPKHIAFDVGSKDTYGAYFATFLDEDGSLTLRATEEDSCRPTLAGSAGMIRAVTGGYEQLAANIWYKLSGLDDGGERGDNTDDDRCDLLSDAEYPFWVCDRGSMSVSSLTIQPNDREQTTERTKENWGRIAHFGDALADGVPLSGDIGIVGPHDHSKRGGWFVQFYESANDYATWSSPKELHIGDMQVEDGATLVFALAYPAGTIFNIGRVSSPGGATVYTEAASIAEIREDDSGSLYFFDGTYLYLRAVSVIDSNVGFGEGGLFVPYRNPRWASEFKVFATWAGATGCAANADYCKAETNEPPAVSVGEIAGVTAAFECSVAEEYWPIKDGWGETVVEVEEEDAPTDAPTAAPTMTEEEEEEEEEEEVGVLDIGSDSSAARLSFSFTAAAAAAIGWALAKAF